MGLASSQLLLTHFLSLPGYNLPILQPHISVPDVTKQQCVEALVVVPELIGTSIIGDAVHLANLCTKTRI